MAEPSTTTSLLTAIWTFWVNGILVAVTGDHAITSIAIAVTAVMVIMGVLVYLLLDNLVLRRFVSDSSLTRWPSIVISVAFVFILLFSGSIVLIATSLMLIGTLLVLMFIAVVAYFGFAMGFKGAAIGREAWVDARQSWQDSRKKGYDIDRQKTDTLREARTMERDKQWEKAADKAIDNIEKFNDYSEGIDTQAIATVADLIPVLKRVIALSRSMPIAARSQKPKDMATTSPNGRILMESLNSAAYSIEPHLKALESRKDVVIAETEKLKEYLQNADANLKSVDAQADTVKNALKSDKVRVTKDQQKSVADTLKTMREARTILARTKTKAAKDLLARGVELEGKLKELDSTMTKLVNQDSRSFDTLTNFLNQHKTLSRNRNTKVTKVITDLDKLIAQNSEYRALVIQLQNDTEALKDANISTVMQRANDALATANKLRALHGKDIQARRAMKTEATDLKKSMESLINEEGTIESALNRISSQEAAVKNDTNAESNLQKDVAAFIEEYNTKYAKTTP